MEHRFRNVSEALPALMKHVMGGHEIGSRAGLTKERLYEHIVLERPQGRVVLHPLRNASLPAQIAETMWVLTGRNDVEWLKNYLPRAGEFSDDGETWRGGYGPRLRKWPGMGEIEGVLAQDQLWFIIYELRQNPASRRAVMTIYNPIIDDDPGKDIPCNNWLHFLSREGKLHLHVAIRSNDLMWGWSGINAFEWSALLEIVAGMTGMLVGELHFSISSLHLYARHWAKAERIADVRYSDLRAMNRPDPRFNFQDARKKPSSDLDKLFREWFAAEELIRTRDLRARAVVNDFPEPMLQSWLRVLGFYWSQDQTWLASLLGTPLYVGAMMSPKRERAARPAEPVVAVPPQRKFSKEVAKLHAEKHAAYGDSWKKRGEVFSILPNIARKLDRLSAGTATPDESQADTRIDLLVYLIKYRIWLTDEYGLKPGFGLRGDTGDEPERVGRYLTALDSAWAGVEPHYIDRLQELFECLLKHAGSPRPARRVANVDAMIMMANGLARRAWLDQAAVAAPEDSEDQINTEAVNDR